MRGWGRDRKSEQCNGRSPEYGQQSTAIMLADRGEGWAYCDSPSQVLMLLLLI